MCFVFRLSCFANLILFSAKNNVKLTKDDKRNTKHDVIQQPIFIKILLVFYVSTQNRTIWRI